MHAAHPPSHDALRDHLIRECQAMARSALSSGIEVPASVVRTIEAVERETDFEISDEDENVANEEETTAESAAALVEIEELAAAHHQLAQIVAPATPRAITLMMEEAAKHGIGRFFGAVPLVRQLMVVAILFLASIVACSVSPATTIQPGETQFWNVFNSSGTELLIRIAFLMSAAGLGACFAALFRANRFIVHGTYDPKYAMSYWIRLLLGIISGLVLCELVPIGDNPAIQSVGKPTLALLGGFSGNALYRILQRLVTATESVVRGDTADVVQAQLLAAESKAGEREAQLHVAVMAKLLVLREELNRPDGVAAAKRQVDAILADFGSGASAQPPPTQPPAS